MKKLPRTWFTLVTLLAAISPSVFAESEPTQAADRELAADLKLLQGTWELIHGNEGQGPPTVRSFKVIKGNKEILRRFSIETGQMTHEHAVELQLSKSGGVRVLTFFPVGDLPKNGLSYVYRIDGDDFWDIPGLLQGREFRNYQSKPTVWHWRRVNENEAEAKPAEAGCSPQR